MWFTQNKQSQQNNAQTSPVRTSFQSQMRATTPAQVGSQRVISLIALPGTALTVVGQPIYRTRFEPGTFNEDTALVGQDGWVAPPPLSPNAAIVSRDKPRMGRQTVHVLGADLEHQDFINELTTVYYDAIGSYRRAVDYDTANAQTVRISAWFGWMDQRRRAATTSSRPVLPVDARVHRAGH